MEVRSPPKTRGYLWTSGVIRLFKETIRKGSVCAEGNHISGPGEPEGYGEDNLEEAQLYLPKISSQKREHYRQFVDPRFHDPAKRQKAK